MTIPRTIAAVVMAVLCTMACGDGMTDPPPNRRPVASGAIPTLTVGVGDTASFDASSFFTDPDGDALTYTATSPHPQTASVRASGATVSVTASAKGGVTMLVTATDPGGLSAQQGFAVIVPNRAPAVMDTVPAQTVFVGDTAQVDLEDFFHDPDGDVLAYSATTADTAAVVAWVAGSMLSIHASAQGGSTITVAATDPGGMSAQQGFAVTVPNRDPVVATDSMPALTVFVGGTAEIELAAYFSDPDGDALTFAAASTDSTVALVAVSGHLLTVSARARGAAGVAVTATDPGGLSVQQGFVVIVPNQQPLAVGSIPARILFVGDTVEVALGTYFSDPDGDTLTYMAITSDPAVATATMSDTVLTVAARGQRDRQRHRDRDRSGRAVRPTPVHGHRA